MVLNKVVSSAYIIKLNILLAFGKLFMYIINNKVIDKKVLLFSTVLKKYHYHNWFFVGRLSFVFVTVSLSTFLNLNTESPCFFKQ